MSHAFPLRGEVKLGRDKTNGVVAADQKISRHHATLTPIDDTFIIHDQGSANGTYVNGVLIAQPTRLKHNDKISFGDTIFLFTTSEPDSSIVEVASPPARPAASSSRQSTDQFTVPFIGDGNLPIWAVVGCMGLIIMGLLLAVALLLGIFLGRSQVGAWAFWWLSTNGFII